MKLIPPLVEASSASMSKFTLALLIVTDMYMNVCMCTYLN